jgi:hypothetical protein
MSEIRTGVRLSSPSPPSNTPSVDPQAVSAADLGALGKIELFAIAIFLGSVVGLALSFLYFGSIFASLGRASSSANPSVQSLNFFINSLYATLAISAVLGFFGLYQLRIAFKTLAGIEKERFGLSSTLTLLLLIIQPVTIIGVVILIVGIFSVMSSLPANSSTAPPNIFNPETFTLFLVGSIISGICGIVALIGVIGGPILGLWRAGARYDEDVMKAGAILYFIPLIGSILTLIGVSGAKRKVTSQT